MVLLLPLGGENVEITWLLKKAEIARRNPRRKNSFKLTAAGKLVFRLDQNPNVIRRQDIQHRRVEVLWPREQGGEQDKNVRQTQGIKKPGSERTTLGPVGSTKAAGGPHLFPVYWA